ncbi:MAG: hypothetical protein K9M07_03275 [Simkaniaceae bacterium]|nr:hypothetical protein [Simkaniaceae bacterium]MCF7852245.1 hypothetical protein [Simkaniaceae bacterium]
MRRLRKSFCVLLAIGLTGCHVPSTVALKGSGGRNAFNTTLQMTSNEQMLLNLVRLRYCDTPYFLNVTNITSQVTYEAEANTRFLFPGSDKTNPTSLGGSMLWKSQPTIVYAPVEGKMFSQLLLKPINLLFIQQLVYSGWDVDRLFKLTVQSFGNIYNAPAASGPFPNATPVYKDFYRVTELMRYFQEKNQLHIGVKVEQDDNQKDSDKPASLQIFFPDNGKESQELAKLLGNVSSKQGYYVVDMKLGFKGEGEIGVLPRSILSTMYYLSLGVEVPKSHETNNIGVTTVCKDECDFDWTSMIQSLIKIRCSKDQPRHAYISIKYRGFWFYIDESDVNSKRTFVLLLNLFNLQAGQTDFRSPILTIPVGV